MGIKNLLADLTIDSLYVWKRMGKGQVAHLVPKRNTGLSLISHCGRKGPWAEAPPGCPRCARCEAGHARLTHDAPPPRGSGRLHR